MRLAAFPKCYMDELCVTRGMSLVEWIDMAASLGVDGLEMYPGFFTSLEVSYLSDVRAALRRHKLVSRTAHPPGMSGQSSHRFDRPHPTRHHPAHRPCLLSPHTDVIMT